MGDTSMLEYIPANSFISKSVCSNIENMEFNYFKDIFNYFKDILKFSDKLLLFPEKNESVMDTAKLECTPLISNNTENNLNLNELEKLVDSKYTEIIVRLSNNPAKVQSNMKKKFFQGHLMNKGTVHLIFSYSNTYPV